MKFETIVRKTQPELKKYVTTKLSEMKYKPIVKDGFVYAKGTVPVLLVAHLDTVHKNTPQIICWSGNGRYVMSPQGIGGDDRCGVYMALKLAAKHKCHILFCEDEEIGCVGAKKFTKSNIKPNINYIVEFDRRGHNDAVFYECDNDDFTKFVCKWGFEEEFGSYSDISVIAPHLGVAAVNISSGYYNAHQSHEYVDMKVMDNNVEKVANMIEEKTGKFEYIEAFSRYTSYYNGYTYDGYGKKTTIVPASAYYKKTEYSSAEEKEDKEFEDSYGYYGYDPGRWYGRDQYDDIDIAMLAELPEDAVVFYRGEPFSEDCLLVDECMHVYEYDYNDGIAYRLNGAYVSTMSNFKYNPDEAFECLVVDW